jgi:hypothetical protein
MGGGCVCHAGSTAQHTSTSTISSPPDSAVATLPQLPDALAAAWASAVSVGLVQAQLQVSASATAWATAVADTWESPARACGRAAWGAHTESGWNTSKQG